MKKGRRLQYLRDLENFRVKDGNPDARGWTLIDAESRHIGRVDGILVDTGSEKVRYLDVDLDPRVMDVEKKNNDSVQLHKNDTHMLVPIGLTKIDLEHHLVVCRELTKDQFVKTHRFQRGDKITPDYEYHVVSTLIGPHAIADYQDCVDTKNYTTNDCFYSTNYFNEHLFFRER